MFRSRLRKNGALRKNICLGDKVPLCILDLISADEVISRVGIEYIGERSVARNVTITPDMTLIEIVQCLLCLTQLLIRAVTLLHLKDVVPCIAQEYRRDHTRSCFLVKFRRRCSALRVDEYQFSRRDIETHCPRIRRFRLYRKRQRCLTGKIDTALRDFLKYIDNLVFQVVRIRNNGKFRSITPLTLLPCAEYMILIVHRKVFVDRITTTDRVSLQTINLPRGFPPIRIIYDTRMIFYRGTFSSLFPEDENI